MLLSELLAGDQDIEHAYGVVADVEDERVLPKLKEIGFVLPSSGKMDNLTIDAALLHLLTERIEVVVEASAETPIIDPKDFLRNAAGVGYHVSLLPPPDGDDAAFEAYAQRLEAFAKAFTEVPNFTKSLMPITSYFEYLVVEAIDPEMAASFSPRDPYVVERFASVVTEARSDAFKARMRTAFEEAFGGSERFLAFRKALVAGVYDEVKPMAAEIAAGQARRKAEYLTAQAAEEAQSRGVA